MAAIAIGGIGSRIAGGSFASGAITGTFSYAFSRAVDGARKRAREVAVPDEIKRAVESTLQDAFSNAVNVDKIKVVENSKWADFLSGFTELLTAGRYWVFATTQRDAIYLNSRITAGDFFGDPELLLHEYYHVIRQWNTGAMTNFNYATNPSKWEIPAEIFGQQYRGTYQNHLGGP